MAMKNKPEEQQEKITQDGQPENVADKRKISNIIVNTIFCIIIVLAVAVLAVVIVARVQNKNVSFFGYSFAIVLTESMSPEIEAGSLIVVKECDISADLVGQNVVFISQSGEVSGESIVHKAIDCYEQDGEIYLVTQGVNNPLQDTDPVTADNLLGVCVASSYGLGLVVSFLANYGVPIVIAMVAIPVIVKLVIYIVKTAKNDE
ncbi:MAG: signal peptidase I [Clostridia bacterium]|nr:signal peptidase I [Clostridia bacterium]